MSKADRSIKEKIMLQRTKTPQTEEENTSMLPKIESKKPLSNLSNMTPQDNYNFVSTKRTSSSKDSIMGILTKEALGGLSQQERVLVEELAKKIEEQRKEIEQRNQTLMAIQRNFEGLSTMLKKEKELGIENKKKVTVLTEDNNKLVEENRVLGRRVEDMIDRLKKYEHELDNNAKDKKKINQSLEEQEALRAKIQELQALLEKKKREINDHEAKNKSLSAQIDKFKNAISGLEGDKQKSALQLKEVKIELESSHKENDKLQMAILEYKVKVGDYDKLKEEHQRLIEKKAEVDKENKEYVHDISGLRNEITALRNQNKKLEDGLMNQNLQLKVGNDKEDGLRDEIKELKKIIEAKDSEIFQNHSKIGELQKSLQEESNHRLKYKDVIDRYDVLHKDGSEVSLLKKQDLEKLNKELEQLRAKTADHEELKKKLDKLNHEMEKKNEMIERYVADKQFENDKNHKLEQRIKALEEENKRCIAHNQKLMSALDFKNQSEKEKDGQFSSEIESLRQKLDANLSSLGDANSKYKNLLSEKEQLMKQMNNMSHELESKNKELDTLRRRMESLESEKNYKLKEGDNNITQLKKEVSTLRDQLKAMQDANNKSSSTLNKEIESLKAAIAKKDEEINLLKHTVTKKDEEISELKHNVEQITQGNKSSQKTVVKLEGEIRDLKSTLEIKENQIEAYKKENGSLRSDLEAYGKEAKDMEKNIKELQEKIRILTEKNDDLNNKNKEVTASLKEVSNDLTFSRLRGKQLESSLEELEIKFREVMKKLTELDEQKFKEKLAELENREKQFNKVIAKIDHSQSSLLISLSCCECMSSLKNPVTFLPCKHNYCEKCVPKNGCCKECGNNQEPEFTYRNKLLEDVIAKVSYNQVMLESLKPNE